MATDLVILSASGDSGSAVRLADAMSRLGLSVWCAAHDANPQVDSRMQVGQAMRSARGVAILMDVSQLAPATLAEFQYAKSISRTILEVTEGAGSLVGADAAIPFGGLSRDVVETALRVGAVPSYAGASRSITPPPIKAPVGHRGGSATASTRFYERSGPRAAWAIALIAATMIALALEVILAGQGFVAAQKDDLVTASARAFAHDGYAPWQVGAMCVAAIPFLMWFHRAYTNLYAIGQRDLPFSANLATGGFLIPAAQIYFSFAGMQTLWKGTSPRPDLNDPVGWKGEPTTPTLWFWAVCWILPDYIGRQLLRQTLEESDAAMITHEEAVSRMSGMFLQLTAMSGLELLAGFAIISLILSIVRRQDERYERFAADVAGIAPKPAPRSTWALPALGGLAAAGLILGMGFLNSGVPDIDFEEISTKDYRVSLPEGASENDDDVTVRRDVSSLNGTFTFFAEQLGSPLEQADTNATVRRSIDSVIAEVGVDAEPAIPFTLGTSRGLDVAFTPEEPDEPTWTEGHVRVIVLGQTLCTLISHGEPGQTFAKENQRFMDSLKPSP